jgi:hypothetical protein
MAPVCRDVRRRTGKTVLKKALLSQKKIPEERRDPTKIAPSWESGGKTNVNGKREIAARGNERASLFWYQCIGWLIDDWVRLWLSLLFCF